tara:strand:+ start:51 stop:743 length:693 start_codon:yes stop_codon:yes gene_type:complete
MYFLLLLLLSCVAPLNGFITTTTLFAKKNQALSASAKLNGFITTTTLFAKKNKALSASAKFNVLLLRDNIQLKKQAGTVVQVSPLFWQNVLSKNMLGKLLTDIEVVSFTQEKKDIVEAKVVSAKALKTLLERKKSYDIKQKTGKEGKLFGAVTKKVIATLLAAEISEDKGFSNMLKSSKILSIVASDEDCPDASCPNLSDIKQIGVYEIVLSILPSSDISATVLVNILEL